MGMIALDSTTTLLRLISVQSLIPPGWIDVTESQEAALSTRTYELPSSSVPLPITKTGRVRKEKKTGSKPEGIPSPKDGPRPRGPILEEILVEMQSIPAPKKTKVKVKAKE